MTFANLGVITFFSALAATQFASAQVYTVGETSGQVYEVDPATLTVTPLASIGPNGSNFLQNLLIDTVDASRAYLDLTFAGGFIYGVASGGNNGPNPLLFRLQPSGAEDVGFGVREFETAISGGTETAEEWAEGIAGIGSRLYVAHRAPGQIFTSLSTRLTELGLDGTFIDAFDIEDFPPATADLLSRDIDGLGACGDKALGLDIIFQNDETVLYDLGALPAGMHSVALTIPFPTGLVPPLLEDVAFIDDHSFVMAGTMPPPTDPNARLHFFSYFGGVGVYTGQSVTLIDPATGLADTSIRGVASASEQECGDPPPPEPCPECMPQSDYVCYDLLEHERLKLLEELASEIQDQFVGTKIRLGHPVSLCNPVGIGKEAPEVIEHYVCYSLLEDERTLPQSVTIENIHEQSKLISGSMDRLCLVSSKNHLETLTVP